MNFVLIQGRPTNEPEAKTSNKTGRVFCTFRFAVEGPYRGPDLPKETDFFDVVAFGPTAQGLLKRLGKGKYTTIRGQLKNRSWIDKIGNKRRETVIVVKEYNIHEWTRKSLPFENLADANGDLLVPREITDSLSRQIEAGDEDIPDLEREINDLF